MSHPPPVREPLFAVPLFFGPADRPLFGCCTATAANRQTNLGFVFCPPVGPDYYQTHRALRLLATRLNSLGFGGLRFDYHGCGDSAGSSEESRLGDWLADIATAVDELRRRGAARIGLVGLRLGAALALLGAAERCEADGLVLWDPILDGRSYLGELEEQQRAMTHDLEIRAEPPSKSVKQIEALGFPLSEDLRQDLERIDLAGVARRVAGKVLIVESGPVALAGRLAASLERLGTAVTLRHLPGPAFWVQRPEGAMVPHRAIQEITTWAAETWA